MILEKESGFIQKNPSGKYSGNERNIIFPKQNPKIPSL
jgi:hypothetical protein